MLTVIAAGGRRSSVTVHVQVASAVWHLLAGCIGRARRSVHVGHELDFVQGAGSGSRLGHVAWWFGHGKLMRREPDEPDRRQGRGCGFVFPSL